MIENNDDECNNNYGWFYLKQIGGQSFTDITTCLAVKRIEYHAPMVRTQAEYFRDSMMR